MAIIQLHPVVKFFFSCNALLIHIIDKSSKIKLLIQYQEQKKKKDQFYQEVIRQNLWMVYPIF